MKKVKKETTSKRWQGIGTIIMAGLTSILFPVFCFAQGTNWQLVTPPPLGIPTSFGVVPDNPNRAFIGAEHDGAWEIDPTKGPNFLWRFTDNTLGLSEVHITRFLAARNGASYYLWYLTQHGSTVYSSNNGDTWLYNFIGFEEPWPAMAVDPNNPLNLLAGGRGVIRKNTAGDNGPWLDAKVGVPPNSLVTDIKYADSRYVWASTSDRSAYPSEMYNPLPVCSSGVLRSEDYGQSWTAFNLPATYPNTNCAYAVAPVSSTTVYVATQSGLWLGVYSNGNMSWQEQTINGVPLGSRISDVFYSPGNPPNSLPTVYIGTSIGSVADGVYLGSVIGGPLSLASGFQGHGAVNAIGTTRTDSNMLYVAYASGNIFKSTDYGNSSVQLLGTHAGYPMSTVAIPPTPDGTAVYVGTVCQGGIYKRNPDGVSWTSMHRDPAVICGPHDHFHYVMRIAQHPSNPNITYATDDDQVWGTTNGGVGSWQIKFNTKSLCTVEGIHLHGLAIAPSNPSVLYVGTGFGNWGTFTNHPQVWRSTDAGTTWASYDTFPQLGITNANCNNDPNTPNHTACTSLYTIAVSPANPNWVFVGTFGTENYPGRSGEGQGYGVVRSRDGGQTWDPPITNGLCPNFATGNCTGSPTPTSLSLYVGTVAIDSTGTNVYIATLNGLYTMPVGGNSWRNISSTIQNGTSRFESIALDPDDPTQNTLYAGTSQELQAGDTPAQIYYSTNGGGTWTAWTMPTPPNPPRAWASQFRVRDIQVRSTSQLTQPKAYAVIEGSGIYVLNP